MFNPEAVHIQMLLNDRFTYAADKGDHWRILPSEGPVSGDCEEYFLTLVYELEDRSLTRFWFALITFKYLPWFCLSPGGGGHVVVWCRGLGWTDNIQRGFITQVELAEKGYKVLYPFLFPMVALKFATRNLTGSKGPGQ